MPTVTIRTRDGICTGTPLEGHPDPRVFVRWYSTQDNRIAVSLWSDHQTRIGEGMLRSKDGQWRGRCSEFAGWWDVSGDVGSGRLVFEEPVAADPEDARVADLFAEPQP